MWHFVRDNIDPFSLGLETGQYCVIVFVLKSVDVMALACVY